MSESTESTVSLPQNYPLLPKSKAAIKDSRPPAKTTYNDQFVQPYLNETRRSIIDAIDMKLDIAARRYFTGELSDDDYSKVRDVVYESLNKDENWIADVQDAFNLYVLSNNAYSMTMDAAFQTTQQKVTINNLYEFVSAESSAIANGLPLPVPSLTATYDKKLSELKSKYLEANNQQSKMAIRTFKQMIFVAVYPERPLPLSLEKDSAADDEDEIEVEGGKVDLTCPISRDLYVKPHKSKICGHTYDLEALKIYLRNSHECPECGRPLSMKDVEPDYVMQTRVECYKRDKKLADLVKDRHPDDTEKL